jgi:hypothetical protein
MMPNRTRLESGTRRFRVAAILLGASLLGGATTEDASLLESRRRSIELLSQSDLNQLRRNYDTYLKLPPERRKQLDTLNDELEQDTKNGGHLQKLLEQYNAWLFKLSPFDRDKLLNTADPGERADLVQKLLQEQQKQRYTRATKGLSIPFLGARFEPVAPLTPGQLDTVLAAVEEHYLRDDLKQRAEKSSLPRDRHLQILRATMQQLRRERIAGVKIAPSETALINAIIEAISNPAIKAQLTTANPTPPLRRQIEIRRQLGQMLARSILAEWKDELEESPATNQQIDDATNYWLSNTKDPQKRAALQKRLQTEQGRNLVAAVAAIQFNPRFDNQKPIINWLFRGLSPGPLNRGAARRAAAANPPAAKMSDESDKEPATDQ